jgi:hypothetical protein
MEHWGYTHEVKDAAKRRRRISDKRADHQDIDAPAPPSTDGVNRTG